MSWNPLEWYQKSTSAPKPSVTVGTGGSRSPLRQSLQSDLRGSTNMGGRYTLQQNGPFRVDAPRQSTPQVGPLGGRLDASGAEARFNKEYPQTQPVKQQANNGKTSATGGLKNSVVGAAVYAIGDAVIPHISREAVRGGLVVTGQDTTDFDNLNAGRPVVRNVGGVSYNIATPEGRQGYQKALAKGEKPTAPAKPADSRLDSPIAGKGPKGNEVGSDSDPDEPGLQGPGDPKGPPTGPTPTTERTNANGLKSYGRDLSSLNTFTKAFTGGYEIADINSSFQSNDLPTAYQNGSNKISTEETPYELPDGASPSNVGGKYSMGDGDISIENTGYKIDGKSVPGTVGGNASDPQDGTSDKPDVAENIRQVRMRRKGPRDEGSPRGFNGADFSGSEPSDESLTSPMYKNARRNKIRSTFLDHEGSSVQAIAAANAVAGYGKDSDANARFNVGGKLVYAKDGMQQKAKNAAMMGLDPREFLDIPTTGDTQPDTPAASELSPTPASTVKPGTIEMPENKGGSIETPAPILKVDPAKQKEAEDFMSSHMSMLTRKTK